MRRVGWMGLVLILTVGTASSALAQKRVALVIGNGTYTKVARLNNPKNDAAAMEAMFKAAAFTSVVRLNDLGATAMKGALRDFSDTAQDADIAQRGGLIGFLSLIRSAARPSPPTAARWHPHRPSRSARKT